MNKFNTVRIPWSIVEPIRETVIKEHGQTLEKLHNRGGLSVRELFAHVHRIRLKDFFTKNPYHPRWNEVDDWFSSLTDN